MCSNVCISATVGCGLELAMWCRAAKALETKCTELDKLFRACTVLLAYRVEFSGLALSQMVEGPNFGSID